jgi:hypothetical protein
MTTKNNIFIIEKLYEYIKEIFPKNKKTKMKEKNKTPKVLINEVFPFSYIPNNNKNKKELLEINFENIEILITVYFLIKIKKGNE